MKKINIGGLVVASSLLLPTTALAAGLNGLNDIKFGGFMSARYSQTDSPDYYLGHREDNGINEDGSFYGTKFGLNISSRVNERISIAAQMISQIQESQVHEDSYALQLDWAFVNIELENQMKVRAGKIKFPVGLVNEYVDVGVTYPWIQPPVAIYTEEPSGAQATREAYTGVSLLWSGVAGDWTYGTDLFAGQVDLSEMTIKHLVGVSLRASWNDMVDFQVSTYTGEMQPDDPTTVPPAGIGQFLDGQSHSATVVGLKTDWHNIITYAEIASVNMVLSNDDMDSDSWYVTLGYRMGKWLPHVTVQDWEQKQGYGQEVSTLGLSYTLTSQSVIKVEVSDITSDRLDVNPGMNNAIGLFNTGGSGDLSDNSIRMISVALDTVF